MTGRPSLTKAGTARSLTSWLDHPRFLAVRDGGADFIVADDLVERDKAGAIRTRSPDLMLDAWATAYDFDKHTVVRDT